MRRHAPSWLPRITVGRGEHVQRRFWQAGGGFDRNALEPRIILAMIEYIHANPVRRPGAAWGRLEVVQAAGWFPGKNSLRPDVFDPGGLVGYFRGQG